MWRTMSMASKKAGTAKPVNGSVNGNAAMHQEAQELQVQLRADRISHLRNSHELRQAMMNENSDIETRIAAHDRLMTEDPIVIANIQRYEYTALIDFKRARMEHIIRTGYKSAPHNGNDVRSTAKLPEIRITYADEDPEG